MFEFNKKLVILKILNLLKTQFLNNKMKKRLNFYIFFFKYKKILYKINISLQHNKK